MPVEDGMRSFEPLANIPFDYLSVANELHSGRIKVASGSVAAEYSDMAAPEILFDALLAAADQPPMPEPLPIEPELIARELGLEKLNAPRELGRLRREFAFRNHPDRVPAHMRERAIKRMQVANMLIDEAKCRALDAVRSN
ncbi:hypothetical protein [Mesorhizobium sp. NBSH29]|uniref:hypothetical protein n=1 Tax=Mesorhizobium sp. NBSH29 TaxID=2654249 RepID=UPI00215639EA|nr:hypothetical protein [Mesorhizobium sp. NBSH29]